MSLEFSKTTLPKQLFINNEYVNSKNKKKLSLYNPKDGSLIADDVPLAGEEDVDAAVAAAEKALPGWKAVGANERRNILLKFADLLENHAAALAELTRLTLGAPYEAFGRFESAMAAEVSSEFRVLIRGGSSNCESASATMLGGSTRLEEISILLMAASLRL
jgi:aldehyde dehydrogenase (NAD+)